MPAVSRRKALSLIVDKELHFEGDAHATRVSRNDVEITRTLVWKPCHESSCPFYPFFQFLVRSRPVFVRIDGVVFTALHNDLAGM